MREIKYIGPVHAGFVMSWVVLAASMVAVFVFQVPTLAMSGHLTFGMLLTLLAMPVLAGVSAFFGTIFACWNYNWVARRWGGIKINLS